MNTFVNRAHRLETGFPFTSMWHGFQRFFKVVNSAIQARNGYTRLASLNDAELARRGLKREELPLVIAQKHF